MSQTRQFDNMKHVWTRPNHFILQPLIKYTNNKWKPVRPISNLRWFINKFDLHNCILHFIISRIIFSSDQSACLISPQGVPLQTFPLQTFDSVSWNTSCWRCSYDSDVSEEFTTFGQTLDEEVLQVCQSYLFPEEERVTPASCCSFTSSHRDRVRAEEEELLLFEMFKMAIEAEEDIVSVVSSY